MHLAGRFRLIVFSAAFHQSWTMDRDANGPGRVPAGCSSWQDTVLATPLVPYCLLNSSPSKFLLMADAN